MICKDFAYKGLMKYFEEISNIPRPTFHEEKIADYLCAFSKEQGLECYRDELNNVFIRKSGTVGRENEAPILLQGHTDMVCEKNEGVEHDFLCEGIKLIEKDGWLVADGTTLGADNGVAVATMLYVLSGADGNISSHPPVECLFTASEEVGLSGAEGFDYSKIKARKMINLDSADESQIIAGCAGGQRLTTTLPADTVDADVTNTALRLTIKGLAGGHSGEDIHRGRANANKLMGRVLHMLSQKCDISLATINGGSKDNAITREAEAVITTSDKMAAEEAIKAIEATVFAELSAEDRSFRLCVDECVLPKKVMSADMRDKIIFLLLTVQNGMFEMNTSIPGLVEFSRNLGVVKTTDDGSVELTFAARSPKPSQLAVSNAQLEAYAKQLGMTVEYGAGYPGWIYAEQSEIRDAYAREYEKLYKKAPEITIIHAGLECGIIKEKIADMDIISCGPIVLDLHSPDEAMNIASFERFFTVVKNVIINL